MSNVLEMALDALNEPCPCVNDHGKCKHDIAIAALKEAIAKQGEPVGVVESDDGKVTWRKHANVEPGTKLYTSAPTIPAALFDGFAVYQMLDDKAKARTSPENVADTLDAVVKLLRCEAYTGKGEQP